LKKGTFGFDYESCSKATLMWLRLQLVWGAVHSSELLLVHGAENNQIKNQQGQVAMLKYSLLFSLPQSMF